jgi:hypothetical protein
MKITLLHTAEQNALLRAMANKDRSVAFEAQAAMAKLIEPTLNKVLNNAPVVSNLYETLRFNPDDNPSLPLDLYYDITDKDYINIWSQTKAGGLAYNQVHPTHSEVKFAIYEIDSAVAFDTRYVKRARVDVVSKTFTRIMQEVLLKMERTSILQIFQALANAQTNRLYGTVTDASNYRRLAMTMSTAGVAEIKPEGAGTGASGNVIHISGLPTSNPGPGILWNDGGTPAIGT